MLIKLRSRLWRKPPKAGAVQGGPVFTSITTYPSVMGMSAALFIVTAGVPVFNEPQPNPRGATPSVTLRTFIDDPLRLTLVGQDRLPFRNDWTVPRGASRAPWLYQIEDHVSILGFPVQAQTLWPVPRGPAPARADWVQSSNVALLAPQQAPFYQTSWPNPLGRQIVTFGFVDQPRHLLSGLDVLPLSQSDWPNPRGYVASITLRTWVNVYDLNLIGKDVLPIRQLDQPNPRGPAPSRADWIAGSPISLTTIVVAPFAKYDWPNPRGRPTTFGMVDQPRQLLVGLDALPVRQMDWTVPSGPRRAPDFIQPSNIGLFTAQLSPFYQLDWPVPKGRQPVPQAWTDSYKLTLIGQDALPFRQSEWPVTRSRRVDDLTVAQSGPVIFSLLAAPFYQNDWPVPRGYVPGIMLRTHLEAYKLTLIGQDALPIRQSEWPVPSGPRRAPDWIWPSNIGLFTATLPPFYQTSWPVPRGYQPVPQAWTDSYKLTLVGLDALPVRQQIWPVPTGPQALSQLRTFSDSYKLTLIGQDALPIRQSEWPNPRGPAPARAHWINTSALSLGITVQLPFNVSDWPVPRGSVPGISLRSHLEAYKLLLVGLDQLPLRQLDWPVPAGFRRSGDLAIWLSPGLALTFVAPMPKVQTDWPLPRGYVPSVSLRTWTDPLRLTLVGQDRLPTRQQDWPVPRGAQAGVSLKTFLDPLRLPLYGKDAFTAARNFYSWPNPRGPQPLNLGFGVIPSKGLVAFRPVAGIFTKITTPVVTVTFTEPEAKTKVQNAIGKTTTIIVS